LRSLPLTTPSGFAAPLLLLSVSSLRIHPHIGSVLARSPGKVALSCMMPYKSERLAGCRSLQPARSPRNSLGTRMSHGSSTKDSTIYLSQILRKASVRRAFRQEEGIPFRKWRSQAQNLTLRVCGGHFQSARRFVAKVSCNVPFAGGRSLRRERGFSLTHPGRGSQRNSGRAA